MTNRRLIETIGGRAKAGDPNRSSSLAAHPRVTRTLTRASVGLAAAGVLSVGLSTLGGGLLGTGAAAAMGQGSAGGTVGEVAGEVAGLAADAPVEVATIDSTIPPAGVLDAKVAADAPTVSAQPVVAKPATVVIAAVQQPVATRSTAAVEAVITEVFGADAAAAIGVARCESSLRPEAISRGGGNWGLFQINRIHERRVARMGFTWEQLLDPRVNSQVAKTIFDEQGWGPWACRHAAR